MALAFRDSAALEVAIRTGLVARDAAAAPAKVARGPDDAIVVEPDKKLPIGAIARLRGAGVQVDAVLPPRGHAVRCWAEAIAPVRAPVGATPSLVLFVTERADELIDLAAELLRLGCDRQELMTVRLDGEAIDRGVVRVVDPPTYTVVRALDRERGLRVYTPDPPKQDRVWTELGARHPLAEHLRADADVLLLCSTSGWRTIPDRGWLGIDAALELAVPGRAAPMTPGILPAKRRIELRLSQGRREPPSLWVLRDDAIAKVDQLIASVPEEVVERLTFAVTATPPTGPIVPPTVVIRARTGRHAAPDLSLVAETYAPLVGMPDVYAPAGAIVEPPLRRERLRAVLDVQPREVMWLARVGTQANNSAFRVERIADPAFVPLADWADYVLHASAPALIPWTRATEIDFAGFVSSGLEWASGPPDGAEPRAARSERKPTKTQRGTAAAAPAEPAVAPAEPPSRRAAPPAAAQPPPVATKSQADLDNELAQLETEFIALDAPGDAPERIAQFDRLARAYARLGRRRDAGTCFVRTVWEATPREADARLDAWIAADVGAGAQPSRALERALQQATPDHDAVRAVAAMAARQLPAVAQNAHRVTRWLDDHDGDLDARTLWLSRLGLARLAGGDALMLAHARDRILARLVGGLPVERELPAFLRLAGRSGALGTASGDALGAALEALATKLDKTRRKREPLEAPPHLTNAYVAFQLAYGFARIGRAERARGLAADAQKALAPHLTDRVHAYLAAAFAARIDQAIGGMPAETPLPDELGTQLAALEKMHRYIVDRLRGTSRILEPLERPDAISAWIKNQADVRGPEFEALREVTEPAQRVRLVDNLVTLAEQRDAERDRTLDGIFDVLLLLPESGAVPLLHRAYALIERIAPKLQGGLYAHALVVAGHFGRTELIPALQDGLARSMAHGEPAEVERVLHYALRALRRIGLRNEMASLLARAERAPSGSPADMLRARLAFAGGLAFLGELPRAQPIFEQAVAKLAEIAQVKAKMKERLELVRALALAYAQTPIQYGLAGLAELSDLYKDISDSQSMNTHFCLSVLDFVESIVVGITSDDLALGETGRRFIEDDEHLIRRRLHRDLGGPA